MIARLSMVARRLFQTWEADRISDALSRAMRQITVIMLISDTPNVANIPMTDEVVLSVLRVLVALKVLVALNVLVVLIVLLTVLNIDDNKTISRAPNTQPALVTDTLDKYK
jgi:hypothetical protein